MKEKIDPKDYNHFFQEILFLIQEAQLESYRRVNKILIGFYWTLGEGLAKNLEKYKWGKGVVKNLSKDLQHSFPGIRGFSERNLWNMRKFFLAYHQDAEVQPLLEQIGWSHHMIIIDRVEDPLAREYYIRATRKYGWTARVLMHKIDVGDFERFAISDSHNFEKTLPEHIQKQAKLAIKDSYIFDFLEMEEEHTERELEDGLIRNLQNFILELGLGEFTFVGRQFRITVDEEDYFIDLLFYHRTLQSLVAFDLKTGKFKAEYAGKLNFYLAALDRQIRKKHENPSIGIIMCREKSKTTVEYAFSDIQKPMGISTYHLHKALPKEYQGLLPSPQDLRRKVNEWDKEREKRQKFKEERLVQTMDLDPLKTPAKEASLLSPLPPKKDLVLLRSSSCKIWAENFFKNHKKGKVRKINKKPNQLLFLGQLYKVVAHFDKEQSFVRQRKKELHCHLCRKDLSKVLEEWLKEEGEKYLLERAQYLIKRMGWSEIEVLMRSKKSIWPGWIKGKLSLNFWIVQAPKDVIDYLMIHSLAHLSEKSHNKTFWWRVSQLCPNFNSSHQWLISNRKLIGKLPAL